jgi:hypothetical protein
MSSVLAAAVLVAYEAEFIVVGGCAFVMHGAQATCGDLDIVPRPGTTERLIEALTRLGVPECPPQRVFDGRDVCGFDSPFGRVDVMMQRAREEYDELSARAIDRDVYGVSIRVAALADVRRLRLQFKGAA